MYEQKKKSYKKKFGIFSILERMRIRIRIRFSTNGSEDPYQNETDAQHIYISLYNFFSSSVKLLCSLQTTLYLP